MSSGWLLHLTALTHAVLAIALGALAIQNPHATLTLTLRRQFDQWHGVLSLYKTESALNATALGLEAQRLAWCAKPLPAGTLRPPYCACVAAQHDLFINASKAAPTQDARDGAVRGLVKCLGSPPTWRVWPFWAVHLATPGVYILGTAACLAWAAAGYTLPVWGLITLLFLMLIIPSPMTNCLWALSTLLTGGLIQWVVAPGMAIEGPERGLGTAFWWAEYLTGPVYVFYATVLVGGRDFIFITITFVLALAVSGLALRSYWIDNAFSAGHQLQFKRTLQGIAWVGIAGASAGLTLLFLVHYRTTPPLPTGRIMPLLAGVTLLIPFLQEPDNLGPHLLMWQAILAAVRNLTLFVLVAVDLPKAFDN